MCKNLNFIILLTAFFIISCKIDDSKKHELFVHEKTEWTYALYMAADNNLERFALKNIKEIKENLGTKKINFIVLLDRANGYDKTEGNWTDTKILELQADTAINDDIIVELGEKDTSDISTFTEFLDFTSRYYPSEKFALNIWSHGFGVFPDCKIPKSSRSVIQDYTTGYSEENSIAITELSSALKAFCKNQNKKIEILQFDCCLMQMIEILWQLKDCADFIIGSQTELSGNGSNYSTLYKNFTSNLNTEKCASSLIENFSEKYKNTLVSCTYSAVDMNKFESFTNTFNIFFDNIKNNTKTDFSVIKKHRENLYSYDSNFIEYTDFKSFLSIFETETYDSNTKKALQELMKDYEKIITESFTNNLYSEKKLSGIGINIPYTEKLYSYYNQDAENYLDIYNETCLNFIIEQLSQSQS